MSALPEFLADEASLHELIDGFRNRTWPGAKFSHSAHLAVCVGYIEAYPDALDRLRREIPLYNISQGGMNTDTRGYHETLTVFWHDVVRKFLSEQPKEASLLEKTTAAVREFADKKMLTSQYYDFDVAGSLEARKNYIPPSRPV